jgi:hypothetical protein
LTQALWKNNPLPIENGIVAKQICFQSAGIRKDSGSFFIHFAQSAVFGAFFMQRMCNLGKRAKDI